MNSPERKSAWGGPEEPTKEQLNLAQAIPRLVLASASPARKMELVNAGIEVIVRPTDADEQVPQIVPQEKVMAITRRKMDAYLDRQKPLLPVLTCDTMIAFAGEMIGKPKDRAQAYEQLKAFSGASHEVYTGWALAFPTGSLQLNDRQGKEDEVRPLYFHESRSEEGIEVIWYYDHARVEFHPLTETALQAYLDCGEWKGAAGSYRIQGRGAALIKSIHGDYATVVGLPISMISGIVSNTVLSQ